MSNSKNHLKYEIHDVQMYKYKLAAYSVSYKLAAARTSKGVIAAADGN